LSAQYLKGLAPISPQGGASLVFPLLALGVPSLLSPQQIVVTSVYCYVSMYIGLRSGRPNTRLEIIVEIQDSGDSKRTRGSA
jgi:hypothetical protein